MASEYPQVPGVVAPPPVIFAVALVLGLRLNALVPWRIPDLWPQARLTAASLAIVSGVALSAWSTRAFREARTPVSTRRPATQLVRTGPYGWTRNPDYIAQSLLYAGIAATHLDWWTVSTGTVALAVVHVGVVLREERVLRTRFGDTYAQYCRDVPRWL